MNCIDCIWAIQLDESIQCKKASPDIKSCDGFKRAYRTITEEVKDMLEG